MLVKCLVLGIGLAMDAFAVSIAKGMVLEKNKIKKYAFILAFFFAFFQALMPLIGYLAGINFIHYIEQFDHWIAFILLVGIGINMIKESSEVKDDNCQISFISFKNILILSIATSIDALAAGISLSVMKVNILIAIACIGIITFIFCFIGVLIGKKLGTVFQKYAELLGGGVLIILGIKILLEHLL